MIYREPKDLTSFIDGTVASVRCGAYHTLILTTENKLFGIGKISRGQLGVKKPKEEKQTYRPIEIEIDDKITEIICGSLCSMALVKNIIN